MSISDSMYFSFDGVKSIDKGFAMVTVGGDPDSKAVFGNASVDVIRGYNNHRHLDSTVQRDNITFERTFMPIDVYTGELLKWDNKRSNDFFNWILHDEFKPLRMGDDLGKVFYVIASDTDGLYAPDDRGYITITFETNSPYAWTDVERVIYKGGISRDKDVEIFNISNVAKIYDPKIRIIAGEDEDVVIHNTSIPSNKMEFKIKPNEIVDIDCDYRIISSNIFGENAFARMNGDWIKLRRGSNVLRITGDCTVVFEMQYPIVQ